MRSAFWLSSGQSRYDASRSKFAQDTELGLGSAPSWSVVKTVQTRIKVGERDHHITNKTNQNQTWVRNSYMPPAPPPPTPKQQQKTNKKYTQETTTTHTEKQNPKTATHKTKTINQKATTTTTKTGQNNSKETTQIYTHTKPNKSNNK